MEVRSLRVTKDRKPPLAQEVRVTRVWKRGEISENYNFFPCSIPLKVLVFLCCQSGYGAFNFVWMVS